MVYVSVQLAKQHNVPLSHPTLSKFFFENAELMFAGN